MKVIYLFICVSDNLLSLFLYNSTSYIIDIGEGHELQPPLNYTPSDFTGLSSFRSPLTFKYLYGGSYNINVTVFNHVFTNSTIIPIWVEQVVPTSGI